MVIEAQIYMSLSTGNLSNVIRIRDILRQDSSTILLTLA